MYIAQDTTEEPQTQGYESTQQRRWRRSCITLGVRDLSYEVSACLEARGSKTLPTPFVIAHGPRYHMSVRLCGARPKTRSSPIYINMPGKKAELQTRLKNCRTHMRTTMFKGPSAESSQQSSSDTTSSSKALKTNNPRKTGTLVLCRIN